MLERQLHPDVVEIIYFSGYAASGALYLHFNVRMFLPLASTGRGNLEVCESIGYQPKRDDLLICVRFKISHLISPRLIFLLLRPVMLSLLRPESSLLYCSTLPARRDS